MLARSLRLGGCGNWVIVVPHVRLRFAVLEHGFLELPRTEQITPVLAAAGGVQFRVVRGADEVGGGGLEVVVVVVGILGGTFELVLESMDVLLLLLAEFRELEEFLREFVLLGALLLDDLRQFAYFGVVEVVQLPVALLQSFQSRLHGRGFVIVSSAAHRHAVHGLGLPLLLFWGLQHLLDFPSHRKK